MKLLIFVTLFSAALGQQLLSLSSFKGGNVQNPLLNDAPYGIFVSAHSDNTAALQNIFVVLKDGTQMPLNILRNRKALQTSGQLIPFVVTDSAYLTTTLTTNQLAALNGVIYLSTTAQLNNKNFFVNDIAAAQTINLQTTADDTTTLFLNTHMGTNPYRSTVFSDWKQAASASSFLYAGLPQDGAEPKWHQIFSNPMRISKDDDYQFFSNVERFSLATTAAFYLKTSKGGPSFRIEPGYFNIDGTTTTSTSTTGLFMKPMDAADPSITVHIKRDTKYTGSCGASTIGHLPGGKVSVSVNDGSYTYDDYSVVNDFGMPWSVPRIAENFKIYSTNGKSGAFYTQYFVQQGGVNTGTTSKPGGQTSNPGGPTVPGHVETTTKSSGTIQVFVALMAFIGFSAFL